MLNSYTYEENERFKAILNEIIAFNMTVEVIGSWLWCFSAYEYRTQLKELGFTWCSKKKRGYGMMSHIKDTTRKRYR